MQWKSQRCSKFSVLKGKSSIVLIVGIIVMLLLIPTWYTMLIPFFIGSELEKIDSIATMEGSGLGMAFGAFRVPLLMKAHAYTVDVKGNNVIMRVEANITNTDTNETLTDFSGNSTYVFNKVTRQYVWGAPEADKNRTGYGILYPPHLKAGEDIPNVWSDSLDKTVTLKFKNIVVEEGVTLYRYVLNETIEKELDLPIGRRNCTLTCTTIILIEPLFGAPAYTENDTFSLIAYYEDPYFGLIEYPFIRQLTFRDTDDMKAQGLASAKMAHFGAQLMELYIPTIFGVIAIILTAGLAFNIRRLKKKKAAVPETKPPVSK